jgi:hypothetical protein
MLEIHRLDNIVKPEVKLISRDADTSHSTVYEIRCVVPPNDTSGIEMVMRCGADSIRIHTFWIDSDGKTLMYPGNPRLLNKALHPRQSPRILPADSSTAPLPPWSSDSAIHKPPPDTVDSIRNDEHD